MQGQQVSHYRLTQKLGAGTYGEVWKGVHVHDAQLFVAIKLVHAALATDDAFLTALKAECRVLSRLHHPNIVGFRDLALGDSHPPAMVLELVPGGSLEDRLAAGPQPVDAVVSILDAMLAGLGHAHNKGVVHRDIKPGNVLLDSDGAVRLVDFGIARAADSGQATKTGVVQGTLDYLAPEVFNGSKAGPAADVYAAGLVAWELLTGRRACPEGPLGTKLGWHIGMGLPDVRAERPDCPTWLAEVVAMLGSKDLASRPVDGAAALALLRTQSGAGQPTPSLPAPAPVAPGTVELSTEQVAASLPPQPSSTGPDTVTLHPEAAPPPSTPPSVATTVPHRAAVPTGSPSQPSPPVSRPDSIGSSAPLGPSTPAVSGPKSEAEPKKTRIFVPLSLTAAAFALIVIGGRWMSASEAPPSEPVATEPEPAPPPPPEPEQPGPAPGPTPVATRETKASSREAADADPSEEGTLTISTTPAGATVSLDGQIIGPSPIATVAPYGPHAIRAELPKHKTQSRVVDLRSEQMQITLELQEELNEGREGRVAVFGVPGSKVTIDGTPTGQIPFQLTLPEGTHTFTVSLPGGESFTTERDVRFGAGGRPVTLNLTTP